nr:MAG TPA: hypothetical protein [Caudoviricetes sp.]
MQCESFRTYGTLLIVDSLHNNDTYSNTQGSIEYIVTINSYV